jgi:hypothetical protein
MTVNELIKALQSIADEHGETEVKFGYDYGDYNHTEVARDVDEISTAYVTNSAYVRSDKVVVSDADYYDIEKWYEIDDMTDEQKEEEDYRLAILIR